ncbi:MAG: hypothetical protein QHH19_03050 [Candidatus Thermoplasmatota archaeon]|nr:hypothetical protein [Candidatus Thermoplasmatota archaeon]
MQKKKIIIENKPKTRKKTNKATLQKNKNRIKQKREEIEKFLETKKPSSHWLKGKQIRFNPKIFSRHKKKDSLVKFHLETVKKIDELLADLEKETKEQKKEKTIHSTFGLAELREPLKRKTTPSFETEDMFEIVNPDAGFPQTESHWNVTPPFRFVKKIRESPDIVFIKKDFDERIKDEDFHTRMIGDKDVETQKNIMGFAHIKIRKKDEKAKKEKKVTPEENKKNGVIKTKKALEETKKEIEVKKRELEQAKKEAKKREKELIKKMIEEEKKKKEEEKLKKLEMKKARIEAKKREKELKKKAKMEEKKKKLEAKMALKEEKLRQKKLKEERELEEHKEKTSEPTLGVIDKKTKDTMGHFISGKTEIIELNPLLDDDVRKVLIITDNLLEKLPDDVIDDFVKSKDFELYEKVISKYKIK